MVATTFAISGQVLVKAGSGVNKFLNDAATTPVISGANIIQINGDFIVDQWINEAESTINVASRYNFIDNYTSLNSDVKLILREVATNLAAINAIQYDMSGYTSRVEAEDMINVLRDGALRGLSLLRDKKAQDFIINAGS